MQINQLTPKYINFSVNGNNRQPINTKKAAIKYRTNREFTFLYIKIKSYKLELNV